MKGREREKFAHTICFYAIFHPTFISRALTLSHGMAVVVDLDVTNYKK